MGGAKRVSSSCPRLGMTWGTLRADLLLKPAAGARAVWIMAGVGVLTGILSSLPSPLPDLRFENPDILINAAGIPLHAGIAFGAGMAIMLWLWANRDLSKCLLAMALILMGWLAAVNTANDVMSAVVSSELFGTVEGAKASREVVGWILAGPVGGAIGGGLTAFGAGVPAPALRRPEAWSRDRPRRCGVGSSALSGRRSRPDRASLRALAGGGCGLHRLWPDPPDCMTHPRVSCPAAGAA